MAQQLDIAIRIKSFGLAEIDQINLKLARLKETISQANFAPFLQLGNTVKDISKNVDVLTQTTKKTIDTVVEQASRKVIETVDNTSRHVGRSLEVTFVRFSSLMSGIVGVRIAGSITGLATLFSNSFTKAIDIAITRFAELPKSIVLVGNLLSASGVGITYLASTAELAVKIFSAGALTLGVFPFLLNQTLGLVRRLRGETASSLSPIQHAASLVSLLDSTLSSVFVTTRGIIIGLLGSGLAIFLLGLQNSILVLPAALNIVFGFITNGVRRISINILASLGSGRAAFAKIFFDLRAILLNVLPTILIISKEFAKLGQAKGFSIFGNRQEAPIRTIIQQIKDLPNTFSKFQVFFDKAQQFAKQLSQDITKIKNNLEQAPKQSRFLSPLVLSPPVSTRGETLVAPAKITQSSEAIRKAAQQAVSSVEAVKKSERDIANITQQTAQQIKLSLGTVFLTIFSGKKGLEESRAKFQVLFESLSLFSKGKLDFSSIQKSLIDFLKTVQKQAPELKERIDALLISIQRPSNVKKIGGFLREFVREISDAQNLTKKVGANILKILADAIEKDTNKVVKASEKLVDGFSQFYPQSPAKRGPLRFLPQMGQKIVAQLSDGILKAASLSANAARKIAETIADYFPQSPARLGPLRALFNMGREIISQLVSGIDSGISFVVNQATKLGRVIKETIERSAKIGDISIRTGLSIESIGPLENALAEVNLKSEDLVFSFTKINEILRQSFTPEESEKIRALGINLAEIREAGNPALALFLSLADVVKRFGTQSLQARQALELLGQTGNTNLLLLLAKGSDGIIELLKQGAQLGFVYDENIIKISQALRGLLNRFELLKNFIIDAFIAEVLPSLQKLGEELTITFTKNRDKIFGFIRLISSVTIELVTTLKNFTIFAFENPAKALDILSSLADSVFEFLITTSQQIFDAIGAKLANFGKQTGLFILVNTSAFIKNLSSEIIKLLDPFFLQIKISFLKKYQDFLRDNKTLLGTFFIDAESRASDLTGQIVDLDIAARGLGGFDIGEIVKKTAKETQAELEKLKVTTNDLVVSATDPKLLENLKNSLSQLTNDLKNSFKGTELESEVKSLIDRLTNLLGKPFEEFKEASKQATERVVNDINKISKKQEDAAKTSFLNPDEQINLLKKQNEQEVSLQKQLLDLKFRATGDEEAKRQSERIAFEQQQQQEFEAIKQAGAKREDILQVFALQQIERERFVGQQRNEALVATLSMIETYTQSAGQMFSDLYELSGQKVKEFFFLSKAAAAAESIVNTAKGVALALGQGGILGIAQGALVAAAGTIQLAKIAATTIKGFAHGGFVAGGSGVKDDVPAWLTGGEYVIQAPRVRQYGVGFMEALNRGLLEKNAVSNFVKNLPSAIYKPSMPNYNSGGFVQPLQSLSKQQGQAVNIVNFIDQQIMQQYLATTAGQRTLLNTIGRNREEVRKLIL